MEVGPDTIITVQYAQLHVNTVTWFQMKESVVTNPLATKTQISISFNHSGGEMLAMPWPYLFCFDLKLMSHPLYSLYVVQVVNGYTYTRDNVCVSKPKYPRFIWYQLLVKKKNTHFLKLQFLQDYDLYNWNVRFECATG